jgi:DNA-binding response OmpR family regulator
MLLAVVPIPGTGTSVAIVGHVIAALSDAAAAARAPRVKRPADSGLRLDHLQRRVWADGCEIQLTFQEFELLAFLSATSSARPQPEDTS